MNVAVVWDVAKGRHALVVGGNGHFTPGMQFMSSHLLCDNELLCVRYPSCKVSVHPSRAAAHGDLWNTGHDPLSDAVVLSTSALETPGAYHMPH
jgi:hypothetical protein